jgi:hypothetical protein
MASFRFFNTLSWWISEARAPLDVPPLCAEVIHVLFEYVSNIAKKNRNLTL